MTTSTYTDCACTTHESIGMLDKDHHDWLLGIESRGASGFAEVAAMVDLEPDVVLADFHLSVVQLPEFVSLHDWQDDDGMNRFAIMLADLHRLDRRTRVLVGAR